MYRILWFTLAVAAAGTLVLSIMHPSVQPLIVGLRLLKAAIVMTVAAILFRRRQRDAVAALLSLALLLWTVTSSSDFASSTTALPAVLDRLRFLLFTVALLLFPSGDWRPRWARRLAVITAAVFAIGTAEALNWLPTRSFLPLAIPCVIGAIATLVVRFRTASGEAERLQLKWVALGLVSGIGCILAARAGFALTARTTMPAAAPLLETLFQSGIVLITLGFLVSLLRYRLFDVEAAVTRSAAYGGLTLALLATFAGTEATIENVGQAYLGMGLGNVSAAMAAAVAAVLLNPLHDRISRWAEQHFQRDLMLLKRDLPEVLEDLAATATRPQLATAILPHINAAVHATRSALVGPGGVAIAADGVPLEAVRRWLREEPHKLDTLSDCDRHDSLFPVRLRLTRPISGTAGWILLGPRPDGSLYGKEELKTLDSLQSGVCRALLWVTTREASLKTQRRQRRTLLRELADLRDCLGVMTSGHSPG